MLDASRLLDQNDHADDTQPRRSGSPRRHETAFVLRTSKLHWTAPTARSARRSSSSTRRTPSVRPGASCARVRSAAGRRRGRRGRSPRRTRGFASVSRRRGSPALRRRLPRRAANSRNCSGSSTPVWPAARAGPPRRSPRTCGASEAFD